ncbi:MAG: HAMP domain-containing protein [Flavobacteriales bacterium]|nr:HAMP domain-containing protein [Flavobacteriales bacterium]
MRFADLPVRTKFLITLGIPVLGLVLLIGKQIDSSIKRRNIMHYVDVQARNIDLFSELLHQLQQETVEAVMYLSDDGKPLGRLDLQFAKTDEAASRITDPSLLISRDVQGVDLLARVELLRERIKSRRIAVSDMEQEYRVMRAGILDDLGRMGKLALEPATKDRIYSHLSLLNAFNALVSIRITLGRAFEGDSLEELRASELEDRMALYQNNLLLFERDAAHEVVASYRELFQGPQVNFLRTVIGTVRQRRSLEGSNVDAEQWWRLSEEALDKLRAVERISMEAILETTEENQRYAELRLLVVVLALIGVITVVTIMAFVIMRGMMRTVQEVTAAASALSHGDISVKVPVTSEDEFGAMARSFNLMIDHVRSLSESAEAIGKGNYNEPVPVRGDMDELGIALTRMQENLRAARQMDAEQKKALELEKEKLEQAHDRISVLIKEIHHRVKNNLQVVASLLRLQSGSIEDERLQQVFDQSQSRVTSMALIHEKLYRGDELAHLDLGNYIKELFAELVRLNKVGIKVVYDAEVDEGLEFDMNTMVPLGLVLNELITNSFKHAFVGRTEGRIHLRISQAEDRLYDLIYQDNGVGIPAGQASENGTTLGVSLIESLVEQMNGMVAVEGGDNGTSYHIRFRTR